MNEEIDLIKEWSKSLNTHKMPRWDMLPDIDLYMDQVITYMERQLGIFNNYENNKIITPSMINNYVKDKQIPKPVQKKYSKEHLGYLLTLCMLKQVLPISDISKLINNQANKNEISNLYNNFCEIQDEALQTVSERVDKTIASSTEEVWEDVLAMLALRLAVEANASRIASEKILQILQQKAEKTQNEAKK